jgi:hypothetical protein
MEPKCIHDTFTNDLSNLLENQDLKPFNTVVVCSKHIGEGKQLSNDYPKEEEHRMMSFNYEKSRKGWIPKNIYKQFPHNLERKFVARRELIARLNNSQLNNDNLGHLNKDDQVKASKQLYDSNDTQELFRRVSYPSIKIF